MMFFAKSLAIAVGALLQFAKSNSETQGECSRFGFEMKLMERLVKLEQTGSDVKNLKEEVRILTNKNNELLETLENQRKEAEEKNEQKDLLIDSILRRSSNETLLVKADLHGKRAINQGQVIVFDRIVYNAKDAYNRHTGIFTAPTEGVYIVIIKICNVKGDRTFVGLLKDGFTVSITAYGDENYDTCGTDIVPVYLRVGDKVWAKIDHNTVNLCVPGEGVSSFSVLSLS